MPNVRIAYPPDGASFAIDPGAAGEQAITIKVDVPPAIQEVRLLIDGQPRVLRAPFRIPWAMVPGDHRVRVEADGVAGDEVAVTVE